VPILTATIFILPVFIGLFGTWLPAFGWLPAIGAKTFSLAPWFNLVSYPGFEKAFWHT